ncbi:hypothetical protein BYT27DRAFT_7181615 [Phlegmacium glaucopus]|nr:hypothetical protein BYT27DRAFT_7181615 [Phlegmacium glaucopus]
MGHQYYHHYPNHYHYHHHPNHPHQHSYVGPTRNQRHGGHRMTVASTPYNTIHISSRTTANDHSMGTYPVYAGMGALNDTGVGGATPPSGNPQMGSVQPKRVKRAKRRRSGPPKTQKQQRGQDDLSAYLVPIVETVATTGGPATPTVIPAPAPASMSAAPAQPVASTSTASTSVVPVSMPATTGMRRQGRGTIKKVRKPKVYDYDSDIHRVSSGSETD